MPWSPIRSGARTGPRRMPIVRRTGSVSGRSGPDRCSRTRSGGAATMLELEALIAGALEGRHLSVQHVGSTAVPGLTAKPVIDLDLTVPDVEDEHGYLPRLEQVGFRLIFRDELGGDPHRQLTFASPNANLHVWGPGAIEPQRHAGLPAVVDGPSSGSRPVRGREAGRGGHRPCAPLQRSQVRGRLRHLRTGLPGRSVVRPRPATAGATRTDRGHRLGPRLTVGERVHRHRTEHARIRTN